MPVSECEICSTKFMALVQLSKQRPNFDRNNTTKKRDGIPVNDVTFLFLRFFIIYKKL